MNKVFCSCPTSLGILHVFLRQDNVANLSLSMGMEIFIETLKDSEGDIRLSLISKRELFVEIICEFKPLSSFAKSSILHTEQCPGYAILFISLYSSLNL